MNLDFSKPFLVVGLGVSGRSAVACLLHFGATVTAVDRNRSTLESQEVLALREKGVQLYHEDEITSLDPFGALVVSPGIPQTHVLYAKARAEGKIILGEIELACQLLEGTFLGITGTNGKTTVTLLVTHVLRHCGFNAIALGNVGTPLTQQCMQPQNRDSIYVVELSSYQLETMHTPIISAGVILNVTPDHLDRYNSLEEYAEAKFQLLNCLTPNGVCYIEENCLREFGHLLKGREAQRYGYSADCEINIDIMPAHIQRKKSHDAENIMAAYALCAYVGVTNEQFFDALSSFKKPAHRIEFVREFKGITFYDDSKGTNLDAVVRAVESISGPIVLIAGGVDKGAPYTPWIEAFGGKVRAIFAIGQAAPKIQKDLAGAILVTLCVSLEEAVLKATNFAAAGETVLLSPGCSSFDMFKDYAHRGEVFQGIVKSM